MIFDRAGTSFVYVISKNEFRLQQLDGDKMTSSSVLETFNYKNGTQSSRFSNMGYGSIVTFALLALRFNGVFAQDVLPFSEATWQQADFSHRQMKMLKTLPPPLT